jgi:hypothetical protein
MRQLSKAVILLGASVVVSACSNGYYVNLAELEQRHSTKVGKQSASAPVKRQESQRALASASDHQRPTTGTIGHASDITVGRANEFKPWPKRGTPEAQQIEAEEIAREQRDKEAIKSICRGC